jgi:TetR/AcrR family transcriptional regulator, tetracycline repressor protein
MRATLDRQSVVAAAIRLLNQVGLDGLTLRRLSRELGVQAGALYWHVANKQELLDLMADKIVTEAAEGLDEPLPGQQWEQWLTARVGRLREALLANRDGARLLALTRPTGDRRPSAETLVGALVAAGLKPPDALRALRAINHYVVGAVQVEQAEASDEKPVAPLDRYDTFPMLKAALAKQDDDHRRGQFEYGLQCLLAGIRDSAGLHDSAGLRDPAS